MSGTEIIYEDKNKIEIKVFLNNDKLNIIQILFRVCLIISSSINNIKEGYEIETIKINENEVDRLYHLIIKLISMSASNPELLYSSQIEHQCNILSYFMIAKRLEHLGDSINHMVEIFEKHGQKEEINPILDFLDTTLKRNMTALTSKKTNYFTKTDKSKVKEIRNMIENIKFNYIRMHLLDALRSIIHFEEEMVNIYFDKKLRY